jgi:hypothetical protein
MGNLVVLNVGFVVDRMEASSIRVPDLSNMSGRGAL